MAKNIRFQLTLSIDTPIDYATSALRNYIRFALPVDRFTHKTSETYETLFDIDRVLIRTLDPESIEDISRT